MQSKTEHEGTEKQFALSFAAVMADTPENKNIWRYTPSSQLTMHTVNQTAPDQFEVGKEYYLDFSQAG